MNAEDEHRDGMFILRVDAYKNPEEAEGKRIDQKAGP